MVVLSDEELIALVKEDCPYGDLTTEGLGITNERAHIAYMSRKQSLVVACSEEAARLCELFGVSVQACSISGTLIPPATSFFHAEGPASVILALSKTLQNLFDYCCGVATYTHHLLQTARSVNPKIVVATTRKSIPMTKKIAIKSIKAGGAIPHRLGLSESILIFREHRLFLNDEAAAIASLKACYPEHKVVIEADSPEEAIRFARMGADVIQLEKFPLPLLQQTVRTLKSIPPKPTLIATGGITLANIADYAASGVDLIVTSAPYTAPSADVKVIINKE
ncbi:MAG: ModD protein [Campylobacterales bacterium]